ncbi:hypothetical protein CBR_g34015 [Chara braunii]|uniref:FAD-binding domain-containing protein n=1 Tax=Chara braunii TaxID=69332 RepID=A0A388LHN1_CHABU|nr:hypothetical protein CBR_g34015 [Chara braunii]|eukprot:GBG81834.1 hypothetical protein CBR_g34015 [Chara braunii]
MAPKTLGSVVTVFFFPFEYDSSRFVIIFFQSSGPLTRSLQVALIDSQPVDRMELPHSTSSTPPEVRVSAITPAAANLFKEVGAWDMVMSSHIGRFDRMQVWDSAGQGFVRYDAVDVQAPVLGYVVENKILQGSLVSVLRRKKDSVALICPAKVVSVELPGTRRSPEDQDVKSSQMPGQSVTHMGSSPASEDKEDKDARMASTHDWAKIVLENGRTIHARLLVGADGSRSRVREMVGLRCVKVDYDQRAVIATVGVESYHTTAWQRFLPTGPLALLPAVFS